jgi:mRNA interferase MazF
MVTPSPASVIIVPFPFSDLSGAKLRPALVLAETGHGDYLLCQITSKAYMDHVAVRLTNADLRLGALNAVSYVRPMKLFTASVDLMVKRVAILNTETYRAVLSIAIETLQKNLSLTP